MVLAYQHQDDKGRSKRKLEVFEKHLKEEGLEIETELETVFHLKPTYILIVVMKLFYAVRPPRIIKQIL